MLPPIPAANNAADQQQQQQRNDELLGRIGRPVARPPNAKVSARSELSTGADKKFAQRERLRLRQIQVYRSHDFFDTMRNRLLQESERSVTIKHPITIGIN